MYVVALKNYVCLFSRVFRHEIVTANYSASLNFYYNTLIRENNSTIIFIHEIKFGRYDVDIKSTGQFWIIL